MTDHDVLLEQLRAAARSVDPHPPELEGAARAAFGLYRFDDELAELMHDSSQDMAGVRGSAPGDSPRLLSYTGDGVETDFQLRPTASGYEVTGMVRGPVRAAWLQTPSQRITLDLDDDHRFQLTVTDRPALRLEMETESGVKVVTPWVRLD